MGLRHNLHAGYQQYIDSEDLIRSSNGWGSITVPGGGIILQRHADLLSGDVPAAGHRRRADDPLRVPLAEHRGQRHDHLEELDVQRSASLASNDTLYGQGLQNDASTLSGFVNATGTTSESRKYKMYEIPFSKMLQPRLGATWAYNGKDTVFASYARYNPAASSLPRAASWDRNLLVTQNADFDANGKLFAVETVASSSGKLFVPGPDAATLRRVAGRHGQAVHARPVRRAPTAATARAPTTGRTRTTTRASRSRRRRPAIPQRRCTSPT